MRIFVSRALSIMTILSISISSITLGMGGNRQSLKKLSRSQLAQISRRRFQVKRRGRGRPANGGSWTRLLGLGSKV